MTISDSFAERDALGEKLARHVKDEGAATCQFSIWLDGQLWDIEARLSRLSLDIVKEGEK